MLSVPSKDSLQSTLLCTPDHLGTLWDILNEVSMGVRMLTFEQASIGKLP